MDYGIWGKHLELFELFDDFRKDPVVQEELLGEEVLQEGTGAPEGRADFPLFLQTVIRHRFRERFRTVAAKFQRYTGVENAQDFREHRVSELGSIRGIDAVGELQEYPRLRSSEEPGPSYSVGKYGGIYGVSYELVINDDVDRILNRIPRELGRSTAEFQSQAVVAFIESNPDYIDGDPFFHANHDNLVTGAAAEPSEDNLAAILDTLSNRRDADGMPFSVTPRNIIVKNPSDAMIFERILESTDTGISDTEASTATFARGRKNPLANTLPNDAVITEPWLNDANDWYMTADADERPAFVVAYLRNRKEPFIGQRNPEVRGLGSGPDPYTMEFDSIDFKLRHVFGTGLGDPNAAIKAERT